MKSRRIICIIVAIVFAAIHFIVIGLPSIGHRGYGGEGLGLLHFFVDTPLFLIANYLFPFLLYNSVNFGLILFAGFGTLMYGCIGYYVAKFVLYLKDKTRSAQRDISKQIPDSSGLLKLFCVVLAIICPLLFLGQIVEGWLWNQHYDTFFHNPKFKIAFFIEIFLGLVITIYGVVVAYKIWTGCIKIKHAKNYLLIRLFGFIAIGLIIMLLQHNLLSELSRWGVLEKADRNTIHIILREIIICLPWLLYLLKSKRIQNLQEA